MLFRKINGLVLVGALLFAASCSDSRVRNSNLLVGSSCSRLGAAKASEGLNYVCSSTSKKQKWVAVSLPGKGKTTCKKLGEVRAIKSDDYVCGVFKGKARWAKVNVVASDTTVVNSTVTSQNTNSPSATPVSGSSSGQGTVSPQSTIAVSDSVLPVAGSATDMRSMQVKQTVIQTEEIIWDIPKIVFIQDKSATIPKASVVSGRNIGYVLSDEFSQTYNTGCALNVDTMVLSFNDVGYCGIVASVPAAAGYAAIQKELVVAVDHACRYGLRCKRGDIGPSGGVVVHVAKKPQAWGSFIEAAPIGWGANVVAKLPDELSGSSIDDPKLVLCEKQVIPNANAIGTGWENTRLMAAAGCRAASEVVKINIDGEMNWHIPSYDELQTVCDFFHFNIRRIQCWIPDGSEPNSTGITKTHYWSSTMSVFNNGKADLKKFQSGPEKVTTDAFRPLWIHPVRYIGPSNSETLQIYPLRRILFGSNFKFHVLSKGDAIADNLVTYEVVDSGSAKCRVVKNEVISDAVGSCVIRAKTKSAADMSDLFSAPTTIYFDKSPIRLYIADSEFEFAGVHQKPHQLAISTDSRNLVDATYEIIDSGLSNCTLNQSTVTAPLPGRCTLRAIFGGDNRYFPATSSDFIVNFQPSCETLVADGVAIDSALIYATCYTGAIGPGGGAVFIMKGPNSYFDDSLTGKARNFIEVAPQDWDTTANGTWGCDNVQMGESDLTKLGGGSINTKSVLDQCSSSTNIFKKVSMYRGGGYSDWYVPSSLELNELCKYARNRQIGWFDEPCTGPQTLRNDFAPGVYWSSSQFGAKLGMAQIFGTTALLPDLQVGAQTRLLKSVEGQVRPVRSFCISPKISGTNLSVCKYP